MRRYECLNSKFLFYLEGNAKKGREYDSPVYRQLPNLYVLTQLLLLTPLL